MVIYVFGTFMCDLGVFSYSEKVKQVEEIRRETHREGLTKVYLQIKPEIPPEEDNA